MAGPGERYSALGSWTTVPLRACAASAISSRDRLVSRLRAFRTTSRSAGANVAIRSTDHMMAFQIVRMALPKTPPPTSVKMTERRALGRGGVADHPGRQVAAADCRNLRRDRVREQPAVSCHLA